MLIIISTVVFLKLSAVDSFVAKNISENVIPSKMFELNTNSQSFASTLSVKRISFYGERCQTHYDCSLEKGLTCVNYTCLCASPDYIARMGPDKETPGKITECVLRAGSPCKSDVVFKPMQRRLPSFLWTKLLKNIPFFGDDQGFQFIQGDSNIEKCVDNAKCSNGKCQCLPDHFRDGRGICLRRRAINQQCDTDEFCRTSEGLQCIQGTCQCKLSMVYDEQSRKCRIPVDGACDAYSSSSDFIFDCVRNSECSNDRCVCLEGYTKSSDGSCGVSYGNPCSLENKCSNIELACRSGKCECRFPIHQVYNETLQLCLSKPDGPCKLNDSKCIPFAECVKLSVQEDAMFEYTCKCIQGYDEDQVGECVPSYLSHCSEDEDCDQVSQLTCINGKCTCPDEMLVWDRERRKCVGLVGARCKLINLERILNMRMGIVPSECVENAHCVEVNQVLDGRCKCKSGFYFYKDSLKCVTHV